MKIKEIRELSEDDIKLRIDETRKQIVEQRFQKATSKLTNVSLMRTSRKTLARLLTIQTEKGSK
jgi:large subunit ribosomal protein L29